MPRRGANPNRRFQVRLIKPSHYDDDGYVIQWTRSFIPSNSLAVLYRLVTDAAERMVLGTGTEIDVTAFDETNTRLRIDDLIAQFGDNGNFGLVGLVGVQSNQFPRALDIARQLRAKGINVVIGGFHVSGCAAMLPTTQPDVQTALDLGCSLFLGEAEGRIDQVLIDAAAGSLKPVYDHLNDLPGLDDAPVPVLPRQNFARIIKRTSSFDAGRGCPYQCSFCTIINVQGRKSRYRSPDDIERVLREHWQLGIKRLFITDDNFARNKNWEPILDRIIELRERENIRFRFIIQVDTLCHKLPNFCEKAGRAGIDFVFIGLENINPANLATAKKRQNKITEYRQMLLAWKRAGAITFAGYILGFPGDTAASIREDIEIIKKELPVDILEFFWLTPLPGSEDHKTLWQNKVWMDPDMNKYDLEHVVADHATMSREEAQAVYRSAWSSYYTDAHILTVLRRGAKFGLRMPWLYEMLVGFSTAVPIEKLHPLQAGYMRAKERLSRRPGMPIEPAWKFYPAFWLENTVKSIRALRQWAVVGAAALVFAWNPRRRAYLDAAVTPVADGDTELLQLFTHNAASVQAVEHSRKIAALTAGASR